MFYAPQDTHLIPFTALWLSWPYHDYEGDVVKRFMNFIALQPLVVDEAFMPHMKAVDVPFHLLYGGLICYQRLQSDRPKC